MVANIDKRNNTVVLSLGGNVGDVKQTFIDAINRLKEEVGALIQQSSLYQAKAWGVENQPDFLNQVLVFKTFLSPMDTLKMCLEIEDELGRVRKEKWHKRVIDIDVLFYDNEVINTNDLTIPHPYLHKRNFILDPLVEIMPQFAHPILLKTVGELSGECKDKLLTTKFLD